MEQLTRSWHTLPLGRWQTLIALKASDEVLPISVICAVTGISENDLAGKPLTEINQLSEDIAFIDTQYEAKMPAKQYIINHKVYNVLLNIDKMTTGQFIDYSNFAESKSYPNLAACFLIPKGEQYGDTDPLELAKEFQEHLSTADYSDIMFFFAQGLQLYVGNTLCCSLKELRKKLKRTKEPEQRAKIIQTMEGVTDSLKNGIG